MASGARSPAGRSTLSAWLVLEAKDPRPDHCATIHSPPIERPPSIDCPATELRALGGAAFYQNLHGPRPTAAETGRRFCLLFCWVARSLAGGWMRVPGGCVKSRWVNPSCLCTVSSQSKSIHTHTHIHPTTFATARVCSLRAYSKYKMDRSLWSMCSEGPATRPLLVARCSLFGGMLATNVHAPAGVQASSMQSSQGLRAPISVRPRALVAALVSALSTTCGA